jgi:hypothetical protein
VLGLDPVTEAARLGPLIDLGLGKVGFEVPELASFAGGWEAI